MITGKKYLIRCPACGAEELIASYFGTGRIYCPVKAVYVEAEVIREATTWDALTPWMPSEGPPLPKGFLPAWPWHIGKLHQERTLFES
jgi:hypothetical protein